MIRDKEDQYIMLKGSIQRENLMAVNICAANVSAPTYAIQILMNIKGEINGNTVIVGDF